MSWIDDEAEKHKAIQDAARQGMEMLGRSNYWAALIQRIRDDVEGINAHEYWRARTGSTGLRFEEAGGWYQVVKSGDPAVIVKIRNVVNIEVERDFHDSPYLNPEKYKHKEVLNIGAMGDSVILMTPETKKLIVPQEAAKYILEVIIESLKHTQMASTAPHRNEREVIKDGGRLRCPNK